MSVGPAEREILDAYARLAESVTLVRHHHEHYLDGAAAQAAQVAEAAQAAYESRAAMGFQDTRIVSTTSTSAGAPAASLAQVAPAETGPIAELTREYPWALASFGDPAWESFTPALDAPPPDGIRIGTLRPPGGQSGPSQSGPSQSGQPGQSGPGQPGRALPAVARFTGFGHLLIGEGAPSSQALIPGASGTPGTGPARSLLQAAALRLVLATVPGTVRLALADPAGQGQYLSAFLRLPPALRVGGGIAVSAAQLESLLTRLTEHVVEVTQTRLTNVHDSVESYNAASTGAAVPYTVLVFAGFPAGLTDYAASLLNQLAASGPRAGLYILATTDDGLAAPRASGPVAGAAAAAGASAAVGPHRLPGPATTLTRDPSGALTWNDPEFGRCLIDPEPMPAAARANPWLDAVGQAALAAAQDLPFRRIAPAPARRWTGTTTDGLDVQIGMDSRGEPQHFTLGRRGVHHGLVGGDVRMGKTNLLHVLISQLALRYPPEELELYLLDFKEVEFDAYLTERLPHARAITSRTDREFGLSMLRRFHDEIDRRARLCREARVTDLPDYRRETGRVLPRALVVMDEFQVLFSDEDRLAREAGRLLADIAKRGAAFGLHLLFATQSPGGPLAAYLRPVYEQMALRIALGCTQPSVSQAILGEGNDAATRLTRAGDAIYNDRRGEGANPVMRIAVLPTRERLGLIAAVRDLARGRSYPPPASFDPDAPADFTAHPAAAAFAVAPRWPAPEPAPSVEAWLGEAIEIKPATSALFERYVRSNLLVVGGEEHGHGLLLATALSIAAQLAPADVQITVAEFSRPSSPYHGFFGALAGLPHPIQVAGRRDALAALDDVLDDLDARLDDPDGPPRPERFFLIAGMHRWTELLAEGDYGRPSETASRLVRLADKGPDTGIHVVAWADSYATAERALRRTGIGHFGLRAVLRVLSPAESDALLGVTSAAGLDDDRAFYRETEWPIEQVEKFKPYSIESLRAFAGAPFWSSS